MHALPRAHALLCCCVSRGQVFSSCSPAPRDLAAACRLSLPLQPTLPETWSTRASAVLHDLDRVVGMPVIADDARRRRRRRALLVRVVDSDDNGRRWSLGGKQWQLWWAVGEVKQRGATGPFHVVLDQKHRLLWHRHGLQLCLLARRVDGAMEVSRALVLACFFLLGRERFERLVGAVG